MLIIYLHTDVFKYIKWFNSSFWPTDGTLSGTSTPDESGPGGNGNEQVLHIPQSSRAWASLSDAF